MSELSPRARKILFAVVNEYIETGLPVGSRTLAKNHGVDLSAASIRAVLADLDDAGLLTQPHTSAGRVPTDRAIRFFIDTLMHVKTVPADERAQLDARVAAIFAQSDDPRRESGRLLSELAGGAAVIAPPRVKTRTLGQLRFIPTRRDQLLAVLVFQDGSVENRFLAVDYPIVESELQSVHNLLADVVEGRTLGEVRELFVRRLADQRSELDALRKRAFELGEKATAPQASGKIEKTHEVVIEGQARLLDLAEYGDSARLKKLVLALEEREDILILLDKVLEAGTAAVFVGSETGDLAGAQLSLVAAPYSENGQPGAVGVLGPTRMDYAKVVPIVGAAAAALTGASSSGSGRR
ncbi:MAG: heat-inducible transcriptional repressor HrcA [Polyangiaceae bacterium]